MIEIDKEEIIKLAKLSAIELDKQEIDLCVEEIKAVLNYCDELSNVKVKTSLEPKSGVNIFREDKIKKCESRVLDQAPEKDDNYFVVPKIL